LALEEIVGIQTDPLPKVRAGTAHGSNSCESVRVNSTQSRLANLRSDGDEPYRDATTPLGYLTPTANGASTEGSTRNRRHGTLPA
jgi:hypothetical protein